MSVQPVHLPPSRPPSAPSRDGEVPVEINGRGEDGQKVGDEDSNTAHGL